MAVALQAWTRYLSFPPVKFPREQTEGRARLFFGD